MDKRPTSTYEFGEFRLDVDKRLLLRQNGLPVALMPKAFETLRYLVEHAGKIVEKDELMSAIWTDTIVEENNLSQNISILRKVLGERRGDHRYIATVPGKGFQFVAEVRICVNDISEPTLSTVNGRPAWPHLETESGINKVRPETIGIGKKGRKMFWITGFVILSLLVIGFALFFKGNSRSEPSGIKTMAVLPFKPMVAGDRDEAIEVGMADTLILRLSDNKDIAVRPLSSVRQFGNLSQDALQAGRTLGVDSVLDGSIQRSGDQIRVNVKLFRVADGSTLWSETFDENFTDTFKVQDIISSKVASALVSRVQGEAETGQKYATNPGAYELYWVGRLYQSRVTSSDLKKAIDFYKRAVEIDPNFALAYAGMADTYRTLAVTTYMPSKVVVPLAKASAMRAVELNDKIAETHVTLGWVLWYDWNWKSAEEQLKTAISIAPNNSKAHMAYAHFLSCTGRHNEAIAEGARARELDPTALITMTMEGQFLSFAGKDSEAMERLKKTIEIDPHFWVAYNAIARVYIHQGNFDEAIVMLTKAKELSRGSSEPVFQLGYALAKSGQRQKALDVINEMKAFSEHDYVPSYSFAMVYNGLGETKDALKYLEKSFEDREVSLTFAKIDSRWDNLRTEPEFINIIKKTGLE